ncbi:MAG: hypothetical protein GEU94_15280 [Micromonosporaceae bacterium]|nr:hypothetical protein [Micromonosporaceae bacterium]
MDTHGRQHPDEREPWFRTDPPADFSDLGGQPVAPGSWAPGADPLTGPLPPGGGEMRPALAEPLEPAPAADNGAAPNVLDTYQPGLVRQHAERLPRYVPPAQPTPGSAPPASAPPAPSELPPGAPFDSSTGALPTVAPPFGAPADAGHGDRRGGLGDAEAGIPSSLVPMLSHEEAVPAASPALGSPPGTGTPGQPAPGAPLDPAQPTAAYPRLDSAQQRPPQPAGNPAVLVAVVLGTLLAAAPSVLLLYQSALDASAASASGVVSATLMLIGLPILAAGVYPLLSGGLDAVIPAERTGVRALLTPPAAYLALGVSLLLAAGLAAS